MSQENWTVQTCGQDIWIDMQIDCPIKRREDICRIAFGSPEQHTKRLSRANKIAAAPELLESLNELLEICRWKCSPNDEQLLPGKTNEQAMIDAMAAIAKAKGE